MSRKIAPRERILATASELFHKRGYKEVGINEIIEKSGTAKATFYSNFKSKELLGEAWLQEVHDRSEKNRSELLEDLDDPRKAITDYFKELSKFLKNGCYRGCPYTNTAAVITEDEPTLHDQIVDHKESIRHFFRQLAKSSFEDSKTANLVADQIFLLYSGATTEGQNLKKSWPVTTALEASKTLWDLADPK